MSPASTSLPSATAAHDTPDSNQTSTMSPCFSSARLPHALQPVPGGTRSAAGHVNHAFEPSLRKTSATCSITSGSSRSFPHFPQRKAGIGTPQTRCRDRHQSGRASIMPRMRFSPHAGIHCVLPISASASARSDVGSVASPMRANHCSVARKMIGVLQRQQCGYWWRTDCPGLLSRKPVSASRCTILGLASNTGRPPKSATSAVSLPDASTGA